MQNAVKFSKKGGLIKITLSYHPLKLNDVDVQKLDQIYGRKMGFLVTEVEDCGKGIEPGEVHNLFKMFNQNQGRGI